MNFSAFAAPEEDGMMFSLAAQESRRSFIGWSVSEGDLVTVAAWYDNEFGYATRLAETVATLAAS